MRRSVQRALACVCCTLTLHASAGELPKVLVVPFTVGEGASDTAVVRFGNLIADELKNRGESVKAVTWPMAASPATPAEKPAAKSTKPSAEAVAALDAGKKAFEGGKFPEAAEKLKKGLEVMLADPGTSDDSRVVDSYLSLAVSAFRNGDDKEAQAALIALVRWDSKFAVPAGFPPVFTRELEKAKKKLAKQPKGSLSIEGAAGSTAFVDGRDLGMVPVLDENLAAGPHYVRVEGAHGQRFGQVVEIKGGVSRVKANFGERPVAQGLGPEVPMVGPQIDEAKANRLAVVARNLGADFLVVGWVYRVGEQELLASPAVYSLQKKGVSALTPTVFDADVLTANVEAFKLVDEIVRRVNSFGAPDSYPVSLKSKAIFKVGAKPAVVAAATREPEAASAPKRQVQTGQTKLTPTPEVRALAGKSTLLDGPTVISTPPDDEPIEPPVAKSLPRWVWVAIGAGLAAGIGTGTYFAVSHANRPVTGTVTASW